MGTGSGKLANVQFALSSMQGWRVTMEDAHSHVLPMREHEELSFFGVFDGHGGDLAAKFAAKHVLTYIRNSEAFDDLKDSTDPDILARAMMEGKRFKTRRYISHAKNMCGLNKFGVAGFIDCDDDLREIPACKTGEDFSGSTGVAAFVTPDNIIIANTGDSRVCLCKSDKVVFGSIDHKPGDDRERARVERAGGVIADGRVNGDLASARSFGDFRYKDEALPPQKQQITVMPDVTILSRSPEDQFLLLACDGIWDVMSNLEATRYVLSALRMGCSEAQACEMLLDECLRKSSGDNMSVLLVSLDARPAETGTRKGALPTSDEVRERMVDSII